LIDTGKCNHGSDISQFLLCFIIFKHIIDLINTQEEEERMNIRFTLSSLHHNSHEEYYVLLNYWGETDRNDIKGEWLHNLSSASWGPRRARSAITIWGEEKPCPSAHSLAGKTIALRFFFWYSSLQLIAYIQNNVWANQDDT
jgi:hypothetical protein